METIRFPSDALRRAMERQARSTSLFTSTNQSNMHMRHVLERLGYEPSGVIHNLDPGDPELVFVKHMGKVRDEANRPNPLGEQGSVGRRI